MNIETRTPSDRLFRSHEPVTTHCSQGELEIVAAQADSSFDAESMTLSLNLAPPAGTAGTVLAGKTLAEIEQLAITETLQSTGGNKAMAARILGISEKSIYNKMKRFKDGVL